jgi:CRP/FNR family transcriptional regulator, cyclic AMP receptor protein
MSISTEALHKVPLLSSLDAKELGQLAGELKERQVPAGETVMDEGSGGVAFFIVLDGEAAVTVEGEERATLGPGDYFGEMALLDDRAPRSATIAARTDVRLAHMSTWMFKPFVRDHPDVAWQLLQTLARRVREAGARQER